MPKTERLLIFDRYVIFYYEKIPPHRLNGFPISFRAFSCFSFLLVPSFLLSPNHPTGLGNKTSLSSSVTIYLVALLFLW